MKTLLSMTLFLMIGPAAFARMGWYVTINNQTGYNVFIYPGGSDNWSLYDFGRNQTMGSYEPRTFYTEDSEAFEQLGIVGINIDYGYGYQHVEMWDNGHPYSVTKNISSCRGYVCPELIGSSSDFVTTAIGYEPGDEYSFGTMYAWINLLPQTGNGCAPAAGDLDGDGDAEPVLISNTTWHVYSSGSGFRPGVSQGLGPDSSHELNISGTPLLGDVDGDGKADPVVMDSSGNWYVWFSADGYQMSGPYDLGVPGTPLVADFDGDGLADPAVYVHHISGMLWYKWLSGNNYQADSVLAFGEFGAQPAAGDIDGDGKADYATVDETGDWLVMLSGLHYAIAGYYALGVAGKPLLADFDADGKADPVMVESSGNWYVWPSASGYVRNGPHVLSVP